MNKKGMEAYYLVGLLLVIAGLIVIIFIYNSIKSGIESGTDSEVCRQSVLASTVSKYFGLGNPLLNLKCKTKSRFLEGDKDKVKEEITKDIYDCSYQYMDGKVDFISSWENIGLADFINDYFGDVKPHQCFICYIDNSKNEINFKFEDLKFKKEIKVQLSKDATTISKEKPLFIGFLISKQIFQKDNGVWNGEYKAFVYNLLPAVTLLVPFIDVWTNGEHYSATFVFDEKLLKEVCGNDRITVFK